MFKGNKTLNRIEKTICDSTAITQILLKNTYKKFYPYIILEDSNVAILGSWYASILLPYYTIR